MTTLNLAQEFDMNMTYTFLGAPSLKDKYDICEFANKGCVGALNPKIFNPYLEVLK